MGAIKGVGASAVEAIIEERERHGPYKNLPDLCRRIDLQRVNRRVLDALIRSGSLDLSAAASIYSGSTGACSMR
jgi:DNA polymerase-3 subunit alpha